MEKTVITIIPGENWADVCFTPAEGEKAERRVTYGEFEGFAESYPEAEIVCVSVRDLLNRIPGGYFPGILDLEIAKQLLAKSTCITVEDQLETHQQILEAYEKLRDLLKENGLERYYREHCLPLNCITWQMAQTGVTIDVPYLKKLKAVCEKKVKDLHQELEVVAGTRFPCNEAGMRWLLYDRLRVLSGQDGKRPVNQKALGSKEGDRYVQKVKDIRELKEALKAIEMLLSSVKTDGRIHPQFNLFNADTGRISVSDPPLQSMPVHSRLGKLVRRAITAQEGSVLIDADYSQIELRILAALSGDQKMIADYQEGVDLHKSVASKAYGVSMEEVTGEQRSKAKAVGFGIIYGRGIRSLQAELRCTAKEARELRETFLGNYPEVRRYREACEKKARERGYAETLMGLRRKLNREEGRSTRERYREEAAFNRKAFNTVIQGTAGDVFGAGVVKVYKALRSKRIKADLILLIYDEILLQADRSQVEEVKRVVEAEMMKAWNTEVPLKVEIQEGENWSEVH